MPAIDAHDPGTICWIDLASTDADGATEFYCDLFGWTASEPIENAGGYRLLLHGGRQVAGLAPVWGDTDRSAWSIYVASRDVDQTCAAALVSGGDVVMDAMDVLAAGRMAILRDPAGALISVWQAGEHHGYEAHGEPGTPIWSELVTTSLATAETFYGGVFGWTAEQHEPCGAPYTVWKRGDRLVGGAVEIDETWPEDALPHWRSPSRAPTATPPPRRAARSEAPSGSRRRDIGAGRCALLEDPAGAAFSVITLRTHPE